MKQEKGITLVEICLVGVILSIILLVSWPSLNSFARKSKLESACKNIAYTFNYVRDRSLVEGRSFNVKFDVRSNKYTISREADPVDNPGEFKPVSDSITKRQRWPADIQIRDISHSTVVFDPDDASEDFMISLVNARGEICSLEMEGVTGKCKIE